MVRWGKSIEIVDLTHTHTHTHKLETLTINTLLSLLNERLAEDLPIQILGDTIHLGGKLGKKKKSKDSR